MSSYPAQSYILSLLNQQWFVVIIIVEIYESFPALPLDGFLEKQEKYTSLTLSFFEGFLIYLEHFLE